MPAHRYVTNSELGFDYLRDHLAVSASEVVMREKLHFGVVDEGDSVLIDEVRAHPAFHRMHAPPAWSTRLYAPVRARACLRARMLLTRLRLGLHACARAWHACGPQARVPLIISGRTDAPVAKYEACSKLAATLSVGEHYEVYEKEQTVGMTEAGTRYCETALQVDDLFNPRDPWAAYVTNAIKAKELFVKDKAYIIRDGEALIVDEFSGRVMDGRRWGDGLHQSIEAKEGLTVQGETEVIASVTYQSLFQRFGTLSAMSGTALTEAEEFATIYKLKVRAPCWPRAAPR